MHQRIAKRGKSGDGARKGKRGGRMREKGREERGAKAHSEKLYFFFRDSETTIKIKFAVFSGGRGGKRKIGLNAFLFSRGKRHDNKNLKVQILLSRNSVVIAQAPRDCTSMISKQGTTAKTAPKPSKDSRPSWLSLCPVSVGQAKGGQGAFQNRRHCRPWM